MFFWNTSAVNNLILNHIKLLAKFSKGLQKPQPVLSTYATLIPVLKFSNNNGEVTYLSFVIYR